METDRPFFILGLPRTRTAWLSCVLTMCGRPCFHEGMRGFASFDDYASNRTAAGDSDPALVHWTARLLEQWPAARFVVIHRDAAEALADFVAASPPDMANALRAGWDGVLRACMVTRDLLRGNPNALFVEFAELANNETVQRIIEHVGGTAPSESCLDHWQRLRITTTIAPADVVQPMPAPLEPGRRVRAADVCDVSGLSAVLYEPSAFALVCQWWRHHSGQDLRESVLPPLGVLVQLDGRPVAALWCRESYGVPVAELTFPTTRPGLSLKDARRALLFAVSVLIDAAGKAHEPPADFTSFQVLAPAGMVRFLERLGFRHMLTERKPMLLNL